MPESTISHLAALLQRDACLVGVGNRLKGDDAAGPLLVDALGSVPGVLCLDTGVAPENYLEQIVATGASIVVIVDAMDVGEAPGSVRLFEGASLTGGLSTHALSLELVTDYLRARGVAEVWLLGIQPEHIGLDAELSSPVRCAINEIAAAVSGRAGDEVWPDAKIS
ncbi:MAG: hydrogenase maturation protease [Kiritimatiellae bacterium]|nr:hydrogenase maturation protease [Kiritimatiellia bacterium]